MAEKLEFDLTVKSNDLKKALESASSEAGNLTGVLSVGVNEAFNQATSSAGVLGSVIQGIAAGSAFGVIQASIQAVGSAFNFIVDQSKKAVAAYAEHEDEINRLGQALRITGSDSDSARAGIESFAQGIQDNSRFSRDAILAQVGFAKSLGTSNAEAERLVLAAANLSATLGGSLEENTAKLGKTLSGMPGRFAQLVPELKTLTQEQLKNGDAFDIINKKYSGAAANDLKTYNGAITSLGNSFTQFQTKIGGAIVNSELFQSTLKSVKSLMDSTNLEVERYAFNADKSASSTATLSRTSSQLGTDYSLLTGKIKEINDKMLENNKISKEFGRGDVSAFNKELGEEALALEKVKEKMEENFLYRHSHDKQETTDVKQAPFKDKSEIEAERQKQAEIKSVMISGELERRNAQSALEIETNAASKEIDNLRIEGVIVDSKVFEQRKIQLETDRQVAEIERVKVYETQKAIIEADLKLKKVDTNQAKDLQDIDREKILADKKLALLKISNDAQLKTVKAAQDSEKKIREKSRSEEIQDQNDFFNVAKSLSSAKNKEMAAIGKAAAITDLAIKTPHAVGASFDFGTRLGGPVLGFALGAIAGAAMAEQMAQVAGVGFENGGFVGGMAGASIGPDNRTAQIRDGEMILNANQQKNLLDMINGGGMGGGDTVIHIDGKEVFRAVRNQLKSGMKLA
jgi:hypothetical protein